MRVWAMSKKKSPVQAYRTILDDSGNPRYVNRLLVATPTTGLVRIEWVQARYGQLIPANWSQVIMMQYLDSFIPLRYQVDDAQNRICEQVVNGEHEWLLLIEHDVLIPPDAFIRINKYIQSEEYPVVSGLYYTRSRPSEPLVYRGRGTSFYSDWEMGDKVWVDGVPTGFLLIHAGIIRALWEESEEYNIGNDRCRRVFNTPRNVWFDPESNQFNTMTGTSDLAWCDRIMKDDIFKKAGWDAYADKEFPFLIDTKLNCGHIDVDGTVYP